MVLAGSINKQIVGYINAAGGTRRRPLRQGRQHGQARKVTRTMVDPGSSIEKIYRPRLRRRAREGRHQVLDQILGRELIPVLAPVASSADGRTYNVNADTFAGAIAGALKAKRLLLLTDVPGVLDKSKQLIKELSVDDAAA